MREERGARRGGSTALAAGDLDADGLRDLVAVNGGTPRVSVLRGKSGRSFEPPHTERVIPDARTLAVGDLDGDGRDDIVVASRMTDGVTVLLSSGAEFEPRFVQLPYGSLPTALAVADLDEDGAPEVAVASSGSGSVTILENNGGGDLRVEGLASYRFRPVDLQGDLHVFAEDYDADDSLDLLTLSSATGELAFYRSNSCGGEVEFRRGDADQDGRLLLTDAVVVLSHLFLDGSLISCEDAGDANDDGLLNVTDAVVVLTHLFGPGDEPPAPGPSECGTDPTTDDLPPCRGHCP